MTPVARITMALVALAVLPGGCSQGQGPFRTVQLCLAGPQEVPNFVSFMDVIAQQRDMEFTDRSGATEAELRAIGNDNVRVAHPHVNIGAQYGSDFGFGAGNLGLPTRQMAIGFNGSNLEEAGKFANEAVAQLSTRWRVYEVPRTSGALPLPNCN
ncbi:hypothetical protein ABIC17_001409 [Sphingomonas sp. PvP056]